jgi:transcriptional regulator with XRE-family HTH domain
VIQDVVEALKNIRVEKGMTMDNLSEKTGVSQKHISNIENKKAIPTFDTLRKLAAGLDVDIELIVKDLA